MQGLRALIKFFFAVGIANLKRYIHGIYVRFLLRFYLSIESNKTKKEFCHSYF